MIGGLPENTKEALGRAILHTVEIMAAGTLAAAALAVVFLVLAIRNAGRRRTVYGALAVLLGCAALVPPTILIVAVGP